MSSIKRSVCPYDCPDTCGLLVEVAGNKAIRVSGDPEHPYTRGTLCPKMLHYEKTVHSPLRLTTPLKRSGAKGSGCFTPISWDEAIAAIAASWPQIIARHGAEAILPYSYAGTMGLIQRNAGHPFFHKLGASRLARTICSPAKDAGWRAVMGDTVVPSPETVEESDLILLWGIDAAATSVHFLRGVQAARKKGARVWLINTYQTPTAAAADEVILVRPGSDGALALGLMHILVRDDRIDHHFIQKFVQGFKELCGQVLPDYSPAAVAALTGLTESTIEKLAAAYGSASAPYIRLGSGLSRYGNGAMTIRTIACLPALAGAYGKAGGGCFPGTATGPAFAMADITREDFMTHPTRIINMNQLGQALHDRCKPIMGLYVYHANPAAVTPDQNAILDGLARNDLFTVVHERFMTDTARYADIVLPATSSLEHSDLYRSYGTYYIQRARAVVPPVGDSKSNWEVFSLLAEAMGFEESFFRQGVDQLIDHLLSVPAPMRRGIDTDALDAGKAVKLALPATEEGFRCLTPSGKIEILNPREHYPLPCYLPTYGERNSFPFWLMTAPNLFSLNASFYEQEELRRRQGGMSLQMNPLDAEEKGVADGKPVCAWNDCGEVTFILRLTDTVPRGVVVAEGVWWLEHAPGSRTVNALTSQRLTDKGEGSTFYDNKVDVRPLVNDKTSKAFSEK